MSDEKSRYEQREISYSERRNPSAGTAYTLSVRVRSLRTGLGSCSRRGRGSASHLCTASRGSDTPAECRQSGLRSRMAWRRSFGVLVRVSYRVSHESSTPSSRTRTRRPAHGARLTIPELFRLQDLRLHFPPGKICSFGGGVSEHSSRTFLSRSWRCGMRWRRGEVPTAARH